MIWHWKGSHSWSIVTIAVDDDDDRQHSVTSWTSFYLITASRTSGQFDLWWHLPRKFTSVKDRDKQIRFQETESVTHPINVLCLRTNIKEVNYHLEPWDVLRSISPSPPTPQPINLDYWGAIIQSTSPCITQLSRSQNKQVPHTP